MCEILNAFNSKRIVGGFDCVNHSILHLKLELYGIMDRAYTLMKCCLVGRKQRVIFMDKFLHNNTCYN